MQALTAFTINMHQEGVSEKNRNPVLVHTGMHSRTDIVTAVLVRGCTQVVVPKFLLAMLLKISC